MLELGMHKVLKGSIGNVEEKKGKLSAVGMEKKTEFWLS